MPIYEYECSQCRYYLEVMQKISDAKLKKCPSCGKNALQKLISAPVFRLKGSGWYETDFKSDQERKRNLAGAEKDEAPADSKGAKDGKDGKDSKDSADGKAATEGKDAKGGGSDSAGDAKSAGKDAKGETAPVDKGGKKADKTPERSPSRSARGAKKAPKRAPAKSKSSRKRGRR
jgi:putative FmdB family regulatory protein